jgi:hypothetical protein
MLRAKHQTPKQNNSTRIQRKGGGTYALVDLWLVGSWRTASSFSSSSLPLREAGTDLDGNWSSKANRLCMIPDWGEASCEPDRPGRL